jgi:thioredoxin-like negative regulator of GroEL
MTAKVLKFSASWCEPCKMLKRTIEGEDIGAPVEDVDIDEQPELTQKYGVRGVPTMIIIRDDEELARMSGYHNLSKIQTWVTATLSA